MEARLGFRRHNMLITGRKLLIQSGIDGSEGKLSFRLFSVT